MKLHFAVSQNDLPRKKMIRLMRPNIARFIWIICHV